MAEKVGSQVLQGSGYFYSQGSQRLFQNLDNHLVEFAWENNETNDKAIELDFQKKKLVIVKFG